MGFLFFILIVVLVIGLVVVLGALNFVMSILRSIFSLGRINPKNSSARMHSHDAVKPVSKDKPIFNKREAEDVDFEEVK